MQSIWQKLKRDETGGPTVEYLLVTLGVVIPFAFATPVALDMIRTYMYRTADIVALPFP